MFDRPNGRRISHLIAGILGLAVLAGLIVGGHNWLADHPEHNPWAPFDLADPIGWATRNKLADLRADTGQCHDVLKRSKVSFEGLPEAGDGACRRVDRIRLTEPALAPDSPPTTCAVGAGLKFWLVHGLQPAARRLLGAEIARIEHLGAYSCRRLYGRAEGRWSEHATGNAIDISAFVLDDGRRISIAADWTGTGPEAVFLKRARDDACLAFGTVLSPDYNSAHADHFHLDQQQRGFGGVCR